MGTSIATQIGQRAVSFERQDRLSDFFMYARCKAAAKRGEDSPAQFAEQNGASQRVIEALREVTKAPVGVGTTTDSTWAAPLSAADQLAGAFLEHLKDYGCFDQMLPSMRRQSSRTKITVTTLGSTASRVDEGAPKPVTRMSFFSAQVDLVKVAPMIIVSQETMRYAARDAIEVLKRDL